MHRALVGAEEVIFDAGPGWPTDVEPMPERAMIGIDATSVIAVLIL